jgi:LysM repeat protein
VKIKVKKPKIKVSAPKSISKAISSVGKTASSVAKGDLKGAAAGVSGLAQAGKDFTKDIGSANLRNITGAFGTLGAATGLSPLEDLAYNVNREGQSGIDQYGDAAIDMAANIGTGGAYGMAQQGINAMAQGGIGGLIDPEYIKQGLMSYAASQAGIDPNMLGSAQQLASGDLRGAALQQLGSFGGFNPQQLRTGISALTGDEEGLASGLASQFGANDRVSGMVGQFAGGRGAREVVSDQAGAYAEDEVNQALDRAGVSRDRVRQLQEGVANARQLPTNIIKQAQGQYQIARGDTFNAIANRMGVSPEELRRLNPQIRDINNIAAGARLNLPGVTDESGPIGKGMVESGQMSQGQFDANQAYRSWLDSQKGKGYIGKEKKAAMQKLLQDRAAGRISADDFAVAQTKVEQGQGFLDKAKQLISGNKGPGFLDKAKQFISGNKGALQAGAEVLGAGAGYLAAESGRKEAKKLAQAQLADVQATGKKFEKMQYDPTRYGQEREFIQQRIAGGGITPQEKQMQQQGDLRAARAAAAARLSGMEQQARMAKGATGSGSALAASLAGGQSVMGTQAETNLAREASASQRLEQDIQRQTNLSRQQTSEEADLAQQQGAFGLSRADRAEAARKAMRDLAQIRGQTAGKLAGDVTNLAVRGIESFESPMQEAQTTQPPTQPQQQPPSMQTKAGAAWQVSNQYTPRRTNMQPPPRNQPMPAQKPIGQFNQQNAPQPGQGRGYGVLAPVSQAVQQGQQAIGKVQSTVDEAKKKAEEFTKNPLGSFGIKF